jgi:alkanesulfonate monooxygenase SsuD/methylene tetrahydromethanopterin reductase-like flavin-dependent oxidoreductase (luciferase family)
MKVRIGVAVGALPLDRFGAVLDDLDHLGFDSVWLPESFQRGGLDPLVGLGFAAARVPRLKLGTHLVAPGRNPYVLARELAQLDELSGGRLLLTLVAGIDEPAERAAQGMPRGDRTVWFDEHLDHVREWWAGREVDGLRLDARPRQDPLEVWLGGRAHRALVRAGRISDGWLAGRISFEEAVAAKAVIDDAAAEAGRTISPEHFGTNLGYSWDGELPPLREQIARWVDAGFSKLVVRPVTAPSDWGPELRRLADDVLDLQT